MSTMRGSSEVGFLSSLPEFLMAYNNELDLNENFKQINDSLLGSSLLETVGFDLGTRRIMLVRDVIGIAVNDATGEEDLQKCSLILSALLCEMAIQYRGKAPFSSPGTSLCLLKLLGSNSKFDMSIERREMGIPGTRRSGMAYFTASRKSSTVSALLGTYYPEDSWLQAMFNCYSLYSSMRPELLISYLNNEYQSHKPAWRVHEHLTFPISKMEAFWEDYTTRFVADDSPNEPDIRFIHDRVLDDKIAMLFASILGVPDESVFFCGSKISSKYPNVCPQFSDIFCLTTVIKLRTANFISQVKHLCDQVSNSTSFAFELYGKSLSLMTSLGNIRLLKDFENVIGMGDPSDKIVEYQEVGFGTKNHQIYSPFISARRRADVLKHIMERSGTISQLSRSRRQEILSAAKKIDYSLNKFSNGLVEFRQGRIMELQAALSKNRC